jgi:hypothetical protein
MVQVASEMGPENDLPEGHAVRRTGRLVGALMVVLALVLLAPGAAALPGAGPATQLAIVIGNNRPDTPGRVRLRYADDDAVAMHRLLLEAGVQSHLLAAPDADTRALNPGVQPDGAPRWGDLQRVVRTVAAVLQSARREQRATELFFYFSGHGDVAAGESYLALEDARLTRTRLFEEVLARLPAARRHVIVDACKSYFLAAPKDPGGERTSPKGDLLVTRRADLVGSTGFVLSTSSAGDSHEWERYQGGVFSHEVRSALRGAADADGDGRVTYAELGAFLRAANRGIPNPLLRPDFLLRPPGELSLPLIVWRGAASRLRVDREPAAHLLVESPLGLRLADLPPSRGGVRQIMLPPERPLYIRREDGRAEYLLAPAGEAALSELKPAPVRVASKGALHAALERLFDSPFGQADVDDYRAAFGRQLADEALAARLLADSPSARRRARIQKWAGLSALATAALSLTLGAVAVERYATGGSASQVDREQRNPLIRGLGAASAVLGGIAVGAGVTWLVLRRAESRQAVETP